MKRNKIKIKRTLYNFVKTLEKLEKRLEELEKLENSLRIEKQVNALFFKNLSKVIENYIAYKQHLKKQIEFQVENKLRQFNHSFDVFDNIAFIFYSFASFVREKWLSFKLDRSIKQLHTFTEENYQKEKYALVFEYLQDKVDEKTIKYYFTEKEVEFINVAKKALKGQTLSEKEISFVKAFTKENFAKENDSQNKKLLFDLASLQNLRKHKLATLKI